jgi:acetoin utilization deacetylase AcuC-like enzyme
MTSHSVGLAYDPIFLEHESPPGHAERPERLAACVEALVETRLWEHLVPVECRPATRAELRRVHDELYLDVLEHEARGQSGYLDGDTFFSPQSIDAAWRAAGACVELVESVLAGQQGCGLALVRPPGHHAGRARPAGFCILNNIAVAAAAVRDAGQRVAIVDFDVHHGNGTQDLFYDDPRVLFISMHRYGRAFYPGSGWSAERGAGDGLGTTVNIPLASGAGNREYLTAFAEQVVPELDRYRPDVLLVSAGFDAHRRDPLGGMQVDGEGFAAIISRLADRASVLCRGRWVAVLEGGYDLQALAEGTVALARALLGERAGYGGQSQ